MPRRLRRWVLHYSDQSLFAASLAILNLKRNRHRIDRSTLRDVSLEENNSRHERHTHHPVMGVSRWGEP